MLSSKPKTKDLAAKITSVNFTAAFFPKAFLCLCLFAARAGLTAAEIPDGSNESNAASASVGGQTSETEKELIRDPFWPVGYRPPEQQVESPESEAEVVEAARETNRQLFESARAQALSMLKVGGIIRRGRQIFASVNGQMVKSGDVIVVPWEEYVFRFKIRTIDLNKVRIVPVD